MFKYCVLFTYVSARRGNTYKILYTTLIQIAKHACIHEYTHATYICIYIYIFVKRIIVIKIAQQGEETFTKYYMRYVYKPTNIYKYIHMYIYMYTHPHTYVNIFVKRIFISKIA